MEYSRVMFSRLVSPTTCYSGIRTVSENGSGNLATESDSIQYSAASGEVTGYSLRKIFKTQMVDPLPCVGHSSLQSQRVFVFLRKTSNQNGSSESATPTQTEQHSSLMLSRSLNLSLYDDTFGSDAMNAAASPSTTANATSVKNDIPKDSHSSILLWKNVDTQYQMILPFRLLVPTFSKLCDGQYILWVGSADDSELRCFQILDHRIQSVSFGKLDAVTSPVMAIDCCDDIDQNSLTIGCQDGTVCIMSVSYQLMGDRISLELLTTHNVIVDGPIMSLHLTTTRLLLGSMCGYVCLLLFHGDAWGEPNMVVEDSLWDERYEADDAVQAVEYWMDRIVLGTYSGLVQIHVPVGKTNYAVEWSCRLPDSVHAIASYQNKLLVTTRTSVVVFEAKAKYSAERAKHRLQKILDSNRLSLV